MAKVINNPVVRGISGGIGNMVFRQMPNGETWVSGKQNFDKRKFSKGQKEHQSRFQQAAAYAREAAEDGQKSPYNWALSDWFHPPVIRSIERKDGKIRVNATDNVLVSKVVVKVLDAKGHVIEKGEGIQS